VLHDGLDVVIAEAFGRLHDDLAVFVLVAFLDCFEGFLVGNGILDLASV